MENDILPPSISIPANNNNYVDYEWDIKYGKGYFIYIKTKNPEEKMNSILNILRWIYYNTNKIQKYNKLDEYKDLYNNNMYNELKNYFINRSKVTNNIDSLRYFVDKSLPLLYGTSEILSSYVPKKWEDCEAKVEVDKSFIDLCKDFLFQFTNTGINLDYNIDFISYLFWSKY